MIRRAQPGDRLGIRAADWNLIAAAGDDYARRQHARAETTGTPDPNRTIIDVQNTTPDTLGPGSVLAIYEPLVKPTTSAELDRFLTSAPIMLGRKPTADDAGRGVVLTRTAGPSQIVPAVLSGLCAARVNLQQATDLYADVEPGHADRLISGMGPAALLWIESGGSTPRDAWCIVRIGGASGGSESMRPVWCRLASGQSGSDTEDCSWKYDLWPIGLAVADRTDEKRLAEEQAPIAARLPLTGYERTGGTTWDVGVAALIPDDDGATHWRLIANLSERPTTEGCECQ